LLEVCRGASHSYVINDVTVFCMNVFCIVSEM